MLASEPCCSDLSEMVLQLAGEAGQASLARSGDDPGVRAALDQHVSEIRGLLTRGGRELTLTALLCYAQGFVEAAIGRVWWPQHRQEREPWEDEPALDWESLRLAAVCELFIEVQGLAV